MGVPIHNAATRTRETPVDANDAPLARAVWTTAEQNDLPDASFAVIEEGGKKDASGKTTPRSLRHLPYKDANGKIDLPHLRNALARLPQAKLSPALKAKAQKVLDAAAKEAGVGDASDTGERAANANVATVPDSTDAARSDLVGCLFAPITRRDDDKWEVEGVLTSESVDTYGTIFDYDSAKRAVERWAGNVREQHDVHKAVGRRVQYTFDDENRQVILRAFVSKGAPDTWAKVCDGTLSGFSINAYNAKKQYRSVGNRQVPCYYDYDYGEVSLVDVPSNPDSAGSGLMICRAAAFSPIGQEEVNDVFVEPTQEPVAEVATSAVASDQAIETSASPSPTPTLSMSPVDTAIVAPTKGIAPEIAAQLSAMPQEAQEMIMRAMAMTAESVAARNAVRLPSAAETPATAPSSSSVALAAAADDGVVSDITTEAATEAATNDTQALQRMSIDTVNGAGLMGNDLAAVDDGTDNEQPIGKAMLKESGPTHTHDHAHMSDYGGMHIHSHDHTHQDGTTHSHPHMHNHAHHDHFGDGDHSHPHTHTHDHSHEYRSAAADLSRSNSTPQPVAAATPVPALAPSQSSQTADATLTTTTTAQQEQEQEQHAQARAASHAPFSGSHSHAHPAFGSQGDDAAHEHAHSHDNDANHEHAHEEEGERAVHSGDPADPEMALGVTASVEPEPMTEPETETLARAGQRISSATRTGLHEAALAILRTCDCPVCQDAISLYDPDNDGDDDIDPDGDTDNDAAGADAGARAVATTAGMKRAAAMQHITLKRAARAAIAGEVQREMAPITAAIQQLRGITARLAGVRTPDPEAAATAATATSLEPLTRMAGQLDTLRASMETVAGLVEKIAEQDARVGPVLRAADKTLGLSSNAILDASAAPRSAVASVQELPPDVLAAAYKQLQQQGVLRTQDAQIGAAASVISQSMRHGQGQAAK